MTMTCAVLGKEGTIFLLFSLKKKVTAKANWIGLYWISELKLYFKPSLFTKSLFLICFISLTVIGCSYLSSSKGSVDKRWDDLQAVDILAQSAKIYYIDPLILASFSAKIEQYRKVFA